MGGRVPIGSAGRLVLVVIGSLLAAGLQAPAAQAQLPTGVPGVAAATLAIAGTPRPGETLTVEQPEADAGYQWYRAGQPIPGADSAGYTVVAADVGKPLWVASTLAVADSDPVIARSALVLARPTGQQRVIAWDSPTDSRPPVDLANAVAVAAGREHSLALRADGTVVGWGADDQGQASPPSGLTDVVAIAAGAYFSIALRSDGTVVGWGSNATGQLTAPDGLDDFVAVAAGLSHTVALRADGTVAAWGFGSHPPFTQTLVPGGLRDVTAVAAGGNHTLALKADGTVAAWGYNYNGQSTPPASLEDVVAIAGSLTASLALHADGTMTEWGWTDAAVFPSGQTMVAIASGGDRSFGLRPDGTVVGWAYSEWGATEVPAGLQTATAIAAGEGESLALARVWTDTPTVTGTAAIGETLRARPGDWVPGADLAYEWLRDDVAIPDATAPEFTITGADLGTRLRVRVSGELAGTPLGATTSEPSSPVEPGSFTAPTPKFTGVVATGRVLTAAPGRWSPTPRLSYQWLRNGKAIKGATRDKYRLTSKDAGKRIQLRVTGKLADYTTRTVTGAATAKVMKAAVPAIRGTRATGSKLTVARGKWTAKTRFSYRWLRDGEPIKKATRSTYQLTKADAGRRITVRVTGRRSGYVTVTLTSPATTRILKVATPKIKGIRQVGRLLRAEPGSWSSGATLTYRWYAAGRLVQSSRSPYLWVRSALRGQRVTVKVTGHRSGFAQVSRTSVRTVPIA